MTDSNSTSVPEPTGADPVHSGSSSPVTRAKGPRPTSVSAQPLQYTLAIVLSTLVIPLPIFVGHLVEAILDSVNPANVDVSAELAYLREILGWGFGVLGALFVAIVIIFVMIYRRARTLDVLKLPLLILAIQIVLGVLILLFNAVINGAAGG